MKTELRPAKHLVVPGQVVIEIWHNGKFIGTVSGSDGPGVRINSKYDMVAMQLPLAIEVSIIE